MLKLCVSPLLEVMLALVVPAFSPLTVSFAPSIDAVATARVGDADRVGQRFAAEEVVGWDGLHLLAQRDVEVRERNLLAVAGDRIEQPGRIDLARAHLVAVVGQRSAAMGWFRPTSAT